MAVSLWIVFAMNYVPSRIYISWLHWLLYIVPTVPANFDCRSNLDLIFACLGCLWEADPSEAQQWAICFVKNLQQQIIHGVLKVLQKGFLETRFHNGSDDILRTHHYNFFHAGDRGSLACGGYSFAQELEWFYAWLMAWSKVLVQWQRFSDTWNIPCHVGSLLLETLEGEVPGSQWQDTSGHGWRRGLVAAHLGAYGLTSWEVWCGMFHSSVAYHGGAVRPGPAAAPTDELEMGHFQSSVVKKWKRFKYFSGNSSPEAHRGRSFVASERLSGLGPRWCSAKWADAKARGPWGKIFWTLYFQKVWRRFPSCTTNLHGWCLVPCQSDLSKEEEMRTKFLQKHGCSDNEILPGVCLTQCSFWPGRSRHV